MHSTGSSVWDTGEGLAHVISMHEALTNQTVNSASRLVNTTCILITCARVRPSLESPYALPQTSSAAKIMVQLDRLPQPCVGHTYKSFRVATCAANSQVMKAIWGLKCHGFASIQRLSPLPVGSVQTKTSLLQFTATSLYAITPTFMTVAKTASSE